MSLTERAKVTELIQNLLNAKIIRESDSPFSSPIVLVTKPNGEKRLCIDYRKLNTITEKDRYPIPLMDDQIEKLQGFTYFTSLDMFSGYHLIPVNENSKPKTAFVTCDGHFEFNRMPFGLTNAPSVFQKLMNKILNPLGSSVASAYIDDIICPAKSFEDGLEKLELILKTLTDNNLSLNPKKCYFFQKSITYLGFEINEEGVRPGKEKTKAVALFPVPKNVHNIRYFLGLTGFFRRFIQNYSLLAKPLTKLLKRNRNLNGLKSKK